MSDSWICIYNLCQLGNTTQVGGDQCEDHTMDKHWRRKKETSIYSLRPDPVATPDVKFGKMKGLKTGFHRFVIACTVMAGGDCVYIVAVKKTVQEYTCDL